MKLTHTKLSKLRKRYVDLAVSCTIAGAVIFATQMDRSSKISNLETKHLSSLAQSNIFGFNTRDYHIEKDHVVKKNQVFGDIISENGLSTNVLLMLEHEARDIYDIKNIRAGSKYHIIKKGECSTSACAIVYEPDKTKYVVYDFRDSVHVKLVQKDVETCEQTLHGKITTSLWSSLENNGVNPGIIDLMEDALSSSVDFYHTQPGDEFKLIFENQYIDGELVGMGKLLAACYINENGTNYSIAYKTKDGEDGYFDAEGRPAKKAFLKAPVKFSRISSGYNMRRFHPIKGRTIPHLGTDYAAPYGTEIRTVSDGVVVQAHYSGGNGNFVKIKHDNVYETQYLHMSRFAKGIRPGTRVKQGQTIGYVGSTGLSTGPHVCFRFWKNGQQVNHLKQKLPIAQPMKMTELPNYFKHRDHMIMRLNIIEQNSQAVTNSNTKP